VMTTEVVETRVRTAWIVTDRDIVVRAVAE
jgi:hypothetical protein